MVRKKRRETKKTASNGSCTLGLGDREDRGQVSPPGDSPNTPFTPRRGAVHKAVQLSFPQADDPAMVHLQRQGQLGCARSMEPG